MGKLWDVRLLWARGELPTDYRPNPSLARPTAAMSMGDPVSNIGRIVGPDRGRPELAPRTQGKLQSRRVCDDRTTLHKSGGGLD